MLFSTLLVLLFCVTHLTASTAAQENADVPAEIQMYSTGYTPSELLIAPHTEVIFINADTADLWPATDHHPTHTTYDGTTLTEHCKASAQRSFDACRAIHPGERWSFTFHEPGTFTYHDHLWPHVTGKIIVSDHNQSNGVSSWFEKLILLGGKLFTTAKQAFFGSPPMEPILFTGASDRYVNLTKERDPRWAIEALRTDAISSSTLMARCHEVLHAIGKESFYQYGTFGAASVFQSDFCNSGYIHGVFEAHFSIAGDPKSGIVEACQNYAAVGGRPFDLWQCHHGVGHGFMYFTGGDLDAALALCSQTFSEEEYEGDCRNGVFMELFNSEKLAKESEYLDHNNPSSACDLVSEPKTDCYHYLPTYYFQTQKLRLTEIFEICDTVTPAYRDSCKSGVGGEAMKRSMSEPNTVFLACGLLASLRDQTLCVAGAVSMYINQTASLEESAMLCETIPLLYRTACQHIVDSRASDLAPTT